MDHKANDDSDDEGVEKDSAEDKPARKKVRRLLILVEMVLSVV
jgi:hypothetical protein